MQVLKHLAQLLETLHALGFVHRDIKPANIVDMSQSRSQREWRLIDLATHATIGAYPFQAQWQFTITRAWSCITVTGATNINLGFLRTCDELANGL
jgi:serine/threonine protein kinase